LERVDGDARCQQRGAYDLSATRAFSLEQGGKNACGAVHPGEQVADRNADLQEVIRSRPGE
jgi:hypothetical protein